MVFIDILRPAGLVHLGNDLEHTMGGALVVALVALAIMPVIGIPAYLIAVRLRLASVWTAALTGILAAAALPAISPAHVPFAAVYSLVVLGFMGAVVGIVFWLFVRPWPEPVPEKE